MVRGDTAGKEQPDAAHWRHDSTGELGKEHIEIHIAFTSEGEPGILGTSIVERTTSVRLSGLVSLPNLRIFRFQALDELFPIGRVRGSGNLGNAEAEKFSFF